MRNLIPFLVLIGLATGCGPGAEDVNLRPDFIEFSKSATLSWNDAWAGGDVDGIVDRYAQNALLLPPNSEVIEGRAAIREYWSGGMQAAPIGTITWLEAMDGGDLGVARGRYEIYAADSTLIDRGKYVEVWQVVDGDWEMTRDIWNTSIPLPDPAEAEM